MPSPPLPASPLPRPADGRTDGLRTLLEGRRLYVAANRGPVHYRIQENMLKPAPAAGGLVTALLGVASYVPLTWVATASEAGDRLIASQPSSARAAPGSPRLRFVVASENALNWFYRRFSNPVLWFIQHGLWSQLRRPDLPQVIECGWMQGYRPVNEAFAQAIEQEVHGATRPIILMHDYHFYLLPGLLRKRIPGALLQHFTHIPWPSPRAWEMLLPAIRRELCKGLLGADVAGFQTEASATNFLRCCEHFVPGARVDYVHNTVRLDTHLTRVEAYPISIDPSAVRRLANAPSTLRHKERLQPLAGERTIVRVDRLDPSKNVVLGFRAFGLLLERRPDLIGKVRFLAFLVPSRQSIAEYRRYAQEVWQEVESVNARFAHNGWKPIEVFYEDNRSQAMAGLALADVLLVNPIADGMNLVAKEGPIASERDLVLVLSESCGAHVQMGHAALSIPAEDPDATSRALERALEMPEAERRLRAAALRRAVESEDLSWWVRRQIHDLLEA